MGAVAPRTNLASNLVPTQCTQTGAEERADARRFAPGTECGDRPDHPHPPNPNVTLAEPPTGHAGGCSVAPQGATAGLPRALNPSSHPSEPSPPQDSVQSERLPAPAPGSQPSPEGGEGGGLFAPTHDVPACNPQNPPEVQRDVKVRSSCGQARLVRQGRVRALSMPATRMTLLMARLSTATICLGEAP